ncbi:hypothetical protein HNR02_002613 [Amycolatopsis endophytica]|uniref:Uncharacterized protein n=1 Tax=Amycolatopsis endophytica TaxID=860233 RepID=A0A853B2R0_9PSEU|nr:hypothetical protein [Amycolatopsis endophytica]NYI89290.1 hypothetical protein [Amycolatopsis endophytica]
MVGILAPLSPEVVDQLVMASTFCLEAELAAATRAACDQPPSLSPKISLIEGGISGTSGTGTTLFFVSKKA